MSMPSIGNPLKVRSPILPLALACISAAVLASACKAPAKPQDFNVLLVTIDTLRPDRLSCYSPKYLQTPHVDGLAARGVLFERAFAHAPLTLPSHASILLGSTPLAHGADDNGMRVVPRGVPSLPKTLKAAGYATGLSSAPSRSTPASA